MNKDGWIVKYVELIGKLSFYGSKGNLLLSLLRGIAEIELKIVIVSFALLKTFEKLRLENYCCNFYVLCYVCESCQKKILEGLETLMKRRKYN